MYWDSRLDQRGAKLIPADVQPSQEYWRLADARWLDESESQGLRHIFMEPADLQCRVWWNGGETTAKKDFPMGPNVAPAYSIAPDTGIPADAVHGLGLGSIEQPHHTIHTSYRFRWELAVKDNSHTIHLPTVPVSNGGATHNSASQGVRYPRPQRDTGLGLHGPADSSLTPPDIVAHVEAMQRAGISWYKAVVTDTRHVERCAAYRAHDIMPIVRFYAHEPHPDYTPGRDLVRAYVDAGAVYVEAGNEPNLTLEWKAGHPIDVEKAAGQYLRGAEIVLAAGGVPLLFALSPGGNVLHLDFLRDFLEACLRHDGLDILQRSAQAIHNRPLHQTEIGDRPTTDRHMFRDYELQAEIVRERLGRVLPMLGTESGYSILPNFNGGDDTTWRQRNQEIFRRADPAHPYAWPEYLYCQCYWLETAGGQWAGDEAFGGWMPDSPTAVGAMLLDLRPSWNRNKEPSTQQVEPSPIQPMPTQPATVPPLVHPIADPAKRRITQRFGDNPQNYAQFGLRGHNGLDFGVPTGTPIRAIADGIAINEDFDADGYGLYAKVIHPWGESLYAHLDRRTTGPGQAIRAGSVIGLSGNTGHSTGPHLHFALRVNPYNRNDGWRGYTDPEPYLERGNEQPAQPTDGDVELLAKVITAEARGEPIEGQLAVAWVVLNRVAKPGWWGGNLREVLTKPWQFAPPAKNATETALAVAALAVAGHTLDPVDGSTHFHSGPAPDWADDLTFVRRIGGHSFFR